MKTPIHRTIQEQKLSREYLFNDFNEAISFINSLALIAEKLHHHPDIYLYSYNRLRIEITTHDQDNTLSQKDYELAEKINQTL